MYVEDEYGNEMELDEHYCDEGGHYHPEFAPDGKDLYDSYVERTMKPSLDEQMNSPNFRLTSLEANHTYIVQNIDSVRNEIKKIWKALEDSEYFMSSDIDDTNEEIFLIEERVTNLENKILSLEELIDTIDFELEDLVFDFDSIEARLSGLEEQVEEVCTSIDDRLEELEINKEVSNEWEEEIPIPFWQTDKEAELRQRIEDEEEYFSALENEEFYSREY
jgi:chromosome segregation ATPase